ncbi:MAG: hypothetical protein A2284_11590 [Deltaproteobacteria bacterium RIFOXYA12_FULL_61_11]|nr:MAG: hypothetical protein A2284_11590 [Deltaproteobacteria bacterium RIFOXYA12_FULL_61_11]
MSVEKERLTAYVLDEVEATERAAIEAALAADPELRAEVEELRLLGGELRTVLAAEPEPIFDPKRRQAVEHGPATLGSRGLTYLASWLRWPVLVPVAVCGLLLIVFLSRGPEITPDSKVVETPVPDSAEAEVVAVVPPPVEAAPEPGRAQPTAPRTGTVPTEVAATTAGAEAERTGFQPPPVEPTAMPVQQADQLVALATPPPTPLPQPRPKRDGVLSHLQGVALFDETSSSFGGAGPLMMRTLTPPGAPVMADEGISLPGAQGDPNFNTEAYDRIRDNPFKDPRQDPLSTFSIDVDTAAYANVRRFLERSALPPPDAVRIEELVNYFDYAYPEPTGKEPFAVDVEVNQAPWKPEHRLLRIGIKGRTMKSQARPAANLVFLLDVSGSMNHPDKLPLVQRSLRLLVEQLGPSDRVAIAVYAGSSGLVLPSTPGSEGATILQALDRLQAGGSTNGGQGIRLAYDVARQHFVPGGINRVVLATDGDFNVGVTNRGELTRLIEDQAKSKIFLTVLGFGSGNLKDAQMEELADRGNGQYAYIDRLQEARKVLVEQLGGTLQTIAKDVKLQLEFNPAAVKAYRLIGYENRVLAKEDFNDDTKDAGELGAGHTVTALYELVPSEVAFEFKGVDPLKYQQTAPSGKGTMELGTLKLRYKEPEGSRSGLLAFTLRDKGRKAPERSPDFAFAAAVAGFGLLLRGSEYKAGSSYTQVRELTTPGLARDPHGYRREFLGLVDRAERLALPPPIPDPLPTGEAEPTGGGR